MRTVQVEDVNVILVRGVPEDHTAAMRGVHFRIGTNTASQPDGVHFCNVHVKMGLNQMMESESHLQVVTSRARYDSLGYAKDRDVSLALCFDEVEHSSQ